MTDEMKHKQFVPFPRNKKYLVNRCGEIFSLHRNKIMYQSRSFRGYRTVAISCKTINVSRVVLITFCGEPPSPKHHAAHRDGNKINNHIDNLYWATARENERDKIKHGTVLHGEKAQFAKLTAEDVKLIRSKYRPAKRIPSNVEELATEFRVNQTTINSIVRGHTWKHL